MAAKIKISETTVVNAKDFHVYNKQLNDFTHPNKLIPFTSKTDIYEIGRASCRERVCYWV